MPYNPSINGFCAGKLVAVNRSGVEAEAQVRIGQIGLFNPETQTFLVTFTDGESAGVSADHLRELGELGKPGDGGLPDSFDLFVGPATSQLAIAEEISTCLFEKGFCVLQLAQKKDDLNDAIEHVRNLDANGELARLPEEVEEHYLGSNCKGKVFWLDDDERSRHWQRTLQACDEGLSSIASLIQPYLEDSIGETVADRTPALVSLSLPGEEEEEYPYPIADDEILGVFLGTWKRQILKVYHFLGPATASVVLQSRGSNSAEGLPKGNSSIPISGSSGIILVYRTDCFDFECICGEETLLMMTSYLKYQPPLVLENVDGSMDAINLATEGPPGPKGDCTNIISLATKLAANWDEPETLLTGLTASTDAASKIPLLRFDVDFYWSPDPQNLQSWQMYMRHISVVEGCELFDNKHFEISNVEASGMDPRQRHVLETGAKALLPIGLTKKASNRQTTHGGFAVGTDGYEWAFVPKPDAGGMSGTSSALSITANRFSFVYNLRGPNFFADTACSSSLYAAHLGKFCLMERRWDPLEWFLVMGTQIYLMPGGFIGGCMAHMLSAEGRCFTFNSTADGYQKGDGTNGMLLKYGQLPKERFGVFRASNGNQDGRSASLTAPNGPAQEQCIWGAIREAQMLPPESTAWDCHGTGTALGDPIEVGAVKKVQIKYKRLEPLLMSTIKTNIGHLEGGAAISGCVKCVLEVYLSRCLPTSHLRVLNPHLEHAAFDAIFENEAGHFQYKTGHSHISSFGFGGSNAHGIFWGKKLHEDLDNMQSFIEKLKKMPLPEVRVIGTNPDDWESDWPDPCLKGAKYSVHFHPDDSDDQPLRFVREVLDEDDLKPEDQDWYDICGNFNDWTGDRMLEQSITGLHRFQTDIPENGVLEFRFVKNGNPDLVLAPATDNCSRKSAAIIGPAKDLSNKWAVAGEPGVEIEIELFITNERRSLLWLKR